MASQAYLHSNKGDLGFIRLAEAHDLLVLTEPAAPATPRFDEGQYEPPSEALAGARAALNAVGLETLAVLGICWIWLIARALQ